MARLVASTTCPFCFKKITLQFSEAQLREALEKIEERKRLVEIEHKVTTSRKDRKIGG